MQKLEQVLPGAPKEQIEAVRMVLRVIAETVKEAGPMGAPNGPCYAALMGIVDLDTYTYLVDLLIEAEVISQQFFCFSWVGNFEGQMALFGECL